MFGFIVEIENGASLIKWPNVSLHFLEILGEKRRDKNPTTLIDFGTCSLHTVLNAFKHGEIASGWKVEKLMPLLPKIFEESPSCRDYYKNITFK